MNSEYLNYKPQLERGKAALGLHRYRGIGVNSKRQGSSKRCHLGDHITDTNYHRIETEDRPCELTKRRMELEKEEREKAKRSLSRKNKKVVAK